jgi:transaldolase/glucose-6-phosphate isomerase
MSLNTVASPDLKTGLAANPLRGLQQYGQSVWLDYIRRSLIASGELRRLIEQDGLRGVTSNPSIFEKAIAGSSDYANALDEYAARGLAPEAVYEELAVQDVRDAASVLAGVYEQTHGRDGYVSLEVSPLLAHDADGTIREARRLWSAVARPNAMIKVPATKEGIVALRQLIADGININVTLLFSRSAYEQVADAYLAGLEDRSARGQTLAGIASVASFFVSRIDSAIDAEAHHHDTVRGFRGKVAIANAKLAYQHYLEVTASGRWSALADKGAASQRLLWASTSSKNPNDRDVIYVEELIGEDTVNTIPPATFSAFRDHGRLRPSLTEDVDAAYDTLDSLARAGVALDPITDRLLDDGILQFVEAFARLLSATGARLAGRPIKVDRQTFSLSKADQAAVNASLEAWQHDGKSQRLWNLDASLWTSSDEARWLGWLDVADDQLAHLTTIGRLAADVKTEGFTHVLLLGMGGSSLCPEVLRLTFGHLAGFPELHVLDSTDPAQIRAVEARVDLVRTLFIVSSKSGGTLEPNIFKQYFFERARAALTARDPHADVGQHFVAITDPGSNMQQVAEGDRFRQIFFGLPTIGGRYSALSAFGMVPAAAMGLDVTRLLGGAEEMVHACGPTVPASDNPGVVLGTILGVLATGKRDKVTLITSPGIGDLGAWLEQLLAESTGKAGKGLVPVDGEPVGTPAVYGDDRVFVYLRLESDPDTSQDAAIDVLERSGQPVVRIAVEEPYNLGEEFFRWEMATAVAGSILGINAFNQPDVEASKVATRRLTSEFERTGRLPDEQPFFDSGGIKLFANEANVAALTSRSPRSLDDYLAAHLDRLSAGDYFALLAYIEMNQAHARGLQTIRRLVRDARRVATCVGFGPRFLHSTGQAYKGGPNSGVFLQITCDDRHDLAVPGQTYTFGVVKAAQARGDFQVLNERGRRALRIHVGVDVAAGLGELEQVIRRVVGA